MHCVLYLARVAHLTGTRLEYLCGGEMQRAFIAKALCQESAILLLDEPIASLDPAHDLQVMELLAGLSNARAVCTVMASHDLNLSARYADEATLLHGGRVACQGNPSMVFAPERLEPVYGCGSECCPSSADPGMLLPFPCDVKPLQRRAMPDRSTEVPPVSNRQFPAVPAWPCSFPQGCTCCCAAPLRRHFPTCLRHCLSGSSRWTSLKKPERVAEAAHLPRDTPGRWPRRSPSRLAIADATA